MSSSSLSSVVSGLVRASMGSSVASTVTDEDLDRHIGEIILREAKQKAERYKKDGIHAYLPAADPNVPRANKRFLSSIIRSTDDHNKAILRSQALSAAELKEEREEQERRERRARADEAAQDRLRRLMSGGRRSSRDDRWRPDRERDRERGRKSAKRDYSRENSRSSSRDWERYWNEDEDDDQSRVDSSRRGRRKKGDTRKSRRHCSSSRSQSPPKDKGKSKRRSRSRSPSRSRSDNDAGRNHRRRRRSLFSPSRTPRHDSRQSKRPRHTSSSKSADESHHQRHGSLSLSCSPRRTTPEQLSSLSSKAKPDSPSPDVGEALSPISAFSRTPSPPPISSKMDKYFSPTYDPRLDVAPLVSSSSKLTVDVPATGLVDNAQFEGWDAMLELIRLRREDRAEKKRLERLGLLPEKDKDGRGKKGQGMVSAGAEEGKGIMDIAYQKKGAVREWDVGKGMVSAGAEEGKGIMDLAYQKKGAVREWDVGKGMVSAGVEEGKGIKEIAYQKKGAVREWDMGKEGF